MSSRAWSTSLTLTLLALLFAGGPVFAAIPAGPDAPLWQDFLPQRLAFNRRTIVEAYKAVGTKDERWDAPAIELLEGGVKLMSEAPDTPPAAEVLRRSKALIEKGCADPMVLFIYAQALHATAPGEAADASFKLAASKFETSRYPAFRKAIAAEAVREAWRRSSRQQEAEQASASVLRHLKEAIAQREYAGEEEWLFWEHWGETLDRLAPEQLGNLYEQARKDDAMPWTTNMLGGQYHVKAAWKARGTGWAHTVKPEGWRGMTEHLAEARRLYTAAHELNPKVPFAAGLMIPVAMGSSEQASVEMRQWFDRAVAARLDYIYAYHALLLGMLPRWHGSHEEMLALGQECLATKRFDTNVPWQFAEALQRIQQDEEGGIEFWRRDGVFDSFRAMSEGYANYQGPGASPASREYYLSRLAVVAAALERYEEARKLLDELGDRFAPRTLEFVDARMEDTVGATFAFTGPSAEQLREGTTLARSGQLDAALSVYDRLAREPQPQPAAQSFIAGRAQALRWRVGFDAGELVDLTANDKLHGWRVVRGRWTAEPDGSLVGTTGKDGLLILCDANFGRSYEIAGKIDFPQSKYNARRAGVAVGRPPNLRGESFVMDAVSQTVGVKRDFRYGEDVPAPLNPEPAAEITFVVRVLGDRISAWIDGQPVVRDHEANFGERNDLKVGFGGYYWWEGNSVRFRELTIRQVDAHTPEPEARDGRAPAAPQ
jgi:tetratricopeptide (TPR) repeat protein